MNTIISGNYVGFELAGSYGKVWLVGDNKEVQCNKGTIEKYEVLNTTSVTKSHTTSNTKGKTRKGTTSMAVRGVVGGVLFGPVGAIVGAGTAKNKSKSTIHGTTVETTDRTFTVSVYFKDGTQALLKLDDVGYENLLIAVFAEPYETYADLMKDLAENLAEKKRLEAEMSKKVLKGLFKFVVLPVVYLILISNFPTPMILLTIAGLGWFGYKSIKKRKAKKQQVSATITLKD
jgi:hypothetical protein